MSPPVILGGAALTRRYVENDLTALYRGQLYYGEDAFGGLHIMDRLMNEKRLRSSGSRGVAGLAEKRRVASPADESGRGGMLSHARGGQGDASLSVADAKAGAGRPSRAVLGQQDCRRDRPWRNSSPI